MTAVNDRAAAARHQRRNPKKYWAKKVVERALAKGVLTRGLCCEICGSSRRVEGHHDDYDQPLIVRWLCCKHHNEWHKENGEGRNAHTPRPLVSLPRNLPRKTSRYRGVCRSSRQQLWVAELIVGGKRVLNRKFKDETAAAHAYDEAAILALGNRARLNFPEGN